MVVVNLASPGIRNLAKLKNPVRWDVKIFPQIAETIPPEIYLPRLTHTQKYGKNNLLEIQLHYPARWELHTKRGML